LLAWFPIDDQRIPTPNRCVAALGDHCDSIPDADDIGDASNGAGSGVIEGAQTAAPHWATHQHRELHPWQPNVDAVAGLAAHLGGRIEATRRLADEAKLRRLL
jgi:hypothetical protein